MRRDYRRRRDRGGWQVKVGTHPRFYGLQRWRRPSGDLLITHHAAKTLGLQVGTVLRFSAPPVRTLADMGGDEVRALADRYGCEVRREDWRFEFKL